MKFKLLQKNRMDEKNVFYPPFFSNFRQCFLQEISFLLFSDFEFAILDFEYFDVFCKTANYYLILTQIITEMSLLNVCGKM